MGKGLHNMLRVK